MREPAAHFLPNRPADACDRYLTDSRMNTHLRHAVMLDKYTQEKDAYQEQSVCCLINKYLFSDVTQALLLMPSRTCTYLAVDQTVPGRVYGWRLFA